MGGEQIYPFSSAPPLMIAARIARRLTLFVEVAFVARDDGTATLVSVVRHWERR
jgi:hypothetical protein